MQTQNLLKKATNFQLSLKRIMRFQCVISHLCVSFWLILNNSISASQNYTSYSIAQEINVPSGNTKKFNLNLV